MKVNNHRRAKLSKRVGAIIALAVALVLTVALVFLSVNGWHPQGALYYLQSWMPTTDINSWPEDVSLGLDLKGGVYVEYVASMDDDLAAQGFTLSGLMESTMNVISSRLTEAGYPESTVSKIGDDIIRVEIPDVDDPDEIITLIGSPAKLEFLDPDGNVFMEGRDLQAAYATQDENSKPAIGFTLTNEGKQLFGEMTQKSIGQSLTIQLDGQNLMTATVNTAIWGGSGIITGNFTEDQVKTYATQIQSGSLPLDLVENQRDTISASLGVDALSTSVLAALVGIGLVMLIMIVRYRLSGVMASWALCIYIVLLFWLIAMVPGVQLTLPGIAGVILGIGMAVDANVVIFERVKEEVVKGRPMVHAVRIGFKNAMSAVLDANVTTIIAAVVLMFTGTGSVQGFAVTLLLGVLTSMFTAIVVTRFLLTNLVRIVDKPALLTSAKLDNQEKEAV